MNALIIKKEWLDKILDPVNPKTWEMRSKPTNIRGKIGLIEAGSGFVVGEAVLDRVMDPVDDVTGPLTAAWHKISNYELLKKWKYPWVLKNAKRYNTPIPYQHPKGAVIWVKLHNGKR